MTINVPEETLQMLLKNTELLLGYQKTMDSLIEVVRDLQSEVKKLKVSNVNWKPIESAPKDGTFVLVWNSNGINEVFWDEEEEFWYHDVDGDEYWPLRGDRPTLWTDLPPSPK